MKVFFTLILFLMNAAFGQTHLQSNFTPPAKPSPGKALVYVVRPSLIPYFFKTDVFLDGKESGQQIGSTKGGEYVYFNVEVGEHIIYSYALNWSEIKINAVEGDILYIKQNAYGLPGIIFNELSILELKDAQSYFAKPVLGKITNNTITVQKNSDTLEKNNSKKFNKSISPFLKLEVSFTEPDSNGVVTINIQTNTDTSSLKINGEELGGKVDGSYSVKRVARVGQETKFVLVATDVYGNTDSKTLTVVRQAADSKAVFGQLNAANVKQQPARDAVAIIIGIERYKRVAKADYANADAQDFYDYANRALGIKPENIKLLLDEGADDVEIYKAFQNWLPVKVKKGKTDVYVFYSGHGYPGQDGNSLYILPHGADKDLISKTAISQQEIVSAIQNAQPRTVTMFLDSCYSGQTRGGDVLIAGARPISPKISSNSYPPNFTVISASSNDQISSASPDLKHGIFSYFLMKGMEGDADLSKDGKITAAEMQEYLTDMVGRQAMGMNRKQQPQLFGDADKVLVGR